MRHRPRFFVNRFLLLAASVLGLGWLLPRAGAEDLEYEKHILPILMAKCADCHSTRAEEVKAGLKFDDLNHFRRSFGEDGAVFPGNWDESPLFVTIFRPSDEKGVMPPRGKGERLNLEEVKLVMRWIAEGAPVGGRRGQRGVVPERFEDLFLDLPRDVAEKLAVELAAAPGAGDSGAGDAGGTPVAGGTGEMVPRSEAEEWTNREGRTIQASLLRVEGDAAVLRLPDGAEHRYPLAQLSAESRARAVAQMASGGGEPE